MVTTAFRSVLLASSPGSVPSEFMEVSCSEAVKHIKWILSWRREAWVRGQYPTREGKPGFEANTLQEKGSLGSRLVFCSMTLYVY